MILSNFRIHHVIIEGDRAPQSSPKSLIKLAKLANWLNLTIQDALDTLYELNFVICHVLSHYLIGKRVIQDAHFDRGRPLEGYRVLRCD